ncbi:hypothetical protein TRICHSKD4_4486 [Roseibium sp. TrichSKD4]|nr:hypothetical protein TRICHSKD4_4486 [Roseibium sp. TrichSKD4]
MRILIPAQVAGIFIGLKGMPLRKLHTCHSGHLITQVA